jgi:hypothetical protein
VPLTPANVTDAPTDVPLVVIVLAAVPVKVIRPVALQTVPVDKEKLPEIVSAPVLVNVTVPADTVKLATDKAPVQVTA